MANVLRKRHSCTICGKYFYSTESLSIHVASHSEDVSTSTDLINGITVKCEVPSTSTDYPCILSTLEPLQDAETLPAADPVAEAEQNTEETCDSDECDEGPVIQSSGTTLVCRLCHEFYIRKRRRYENDDVCDMCNKSLVEMGISSNQEPRSDKKHCTCDVCGKVFSLRSNFVKHYRIHLNYRPFRCSVCNRGFFQKKALIAHELIHTGQKPHACALCGKQFTQKSTLRNHFFTHVEEVNRETQIKTELN